MLVVLLVIFMAASVFVLCRKRSREFFFLSGMCICLMLEFCGILFFAAKKDGCSGEVMELLFLSMKLKNAIQHLSVSLDVIGYMAALGRYLFPCFLLQIAFNYSMISVIRRKSLVKRLSAILPAVSLLIYYPGIYKEIVLRNPGLQGVLAKFSYFWILLYLVMALVLLMYEYFSITMAFFRRQFRFLVICMMAVSGLYLFACWQDPGQIYGLYHAPYPWKRGIGLLQHVWNTKAYYLSTLISIVCSILGIMSLFGYIRGNYVNDKEEAVLEQKYGIARAGALAFVHSTKNQLSANRAIFRQMGEMDTDKKEDARKMQEYVTVLEDINEVMLERIEALYQTVKSNSIFMAACRMEEIIASALEKFHNKCPDATVEVVLESNAAVLADKACLCEAIYSLLVNARDAVEEAERGKEGKITLLSRDGRLYTVIEIRDNGAGISKPDMKKIFEPYYTSKNRSHNWGMGLYYVKTVVKGHLGSLRVESKEGKGSSFYILLPKYIS